VCVCLGVCVYDESCKIVNHFLRLCVPVYNNKSEKIMKIPQENRGKTRVYTSICRTGNMKFHTQTKGWIVNLKRTG
jgi:negative regulator of replication initiation